MGCFLQQKDKVFIFPFDGIEQVILSVENAIVEKTPTFWIIKEIKKGTKLSHPTHFFIKDGAIIDNYCHFCLFRLRAMNAGCQTCLFNPIHPTSFNSMNIRSLISSLRKNGSYQVDIHIFKEENRLYKHQQREKLKKQVT